MRPPFSLRLLRRLRRDARGISVTEFGLIAPVFFMLLMGMLDMGHTLYLQSVLQGAVQKAARDSSLESGAESAKQAAVDAAITGQVHRLVANATVTVSRRYFRDFTTAAEAQAEPFTDNNGNGRCDANEPYQDDNNNSVWDADGGNSGQGGAKDSVVYTATVTYPRLFPMAGLAGLSRDVTIQAMTVLANQPYGEQATYGTPTMRTCP